MNARQMTALAWADVLQRVRGSGYLLTLGATAWIGSLVYADNIQMWVGGFRGILNAAWVGTVVALSVTTFVSLAGFYVVKDSIERDRRTGVGQILAATAVSTRTYLLAKRLSNALVLGTIVIALGVVAVLLRAAQGPMAVADAPALLLPLVLLAAPAMCVVAGAAVVFETVPLLAGGLGNVFFVVVWGAALIVPLATGQPWADWSGISLVDASLASAVHAVAPEADAGISFTMGPAKDLSSLMPLEWAGIAWTPVTIAARVSWAVVAVILVAVASPAFDRFDQARVRSQRRAVPVPGRRAWLSRVSVSGLWPGTALWRLVERLAASAGPFGMMVAAELRLALSGTTAWWALVAVGLAVASVLAPLPAARYVHRVAWFWPVLLWSTMGVRESLHRTGPLVFSCPRPLARQFLGLWASGVALAAVTGIGFAGRLTLTGDAVGLAGWVAGACFIPSLALALGVWTTSTRAFEAIYTLWWYIGPMKGIAALDFTGASAQTSTFPVTLAYAGASAGLLALAVVGRQRQIR